MNRQLAIAQAKYFRIGATIIEVESGKEETFQGPCVSSHARTIDVEKDGKVHKNTVYKRSISVRPSISLAKKAARSKKHLVTQQPGENLRKVVARKQEEKARAQEFNTAAGITEKSMKEGG